MRLFRSWLCAILVLAMMFGSVPVTVLAEEVSAPEGSVAEEQTPTTAETAEETEPETAEETVPEPTGETEPEVTEASEIQEKGEVVHIPFQLNPLYEGIYTADDFPGSYPDELYQGELYAATTYLTVAKAGEAVRKAMKNRQESITVNFKTDTSSRQEACEAVLAEAMKHTGNALEGDYLAWQYAGWSGDIVRKYNSNTSMYEYSGTLRISYYTTAQQEKELTTAINKLKTNLKLSSKSNYDKIFAVYDYMCQNITYDYANLNDSSYKLKHTAYAALVNKTAVCQGYALLFYRIMLELGIDCRLIPGMTEGGAHGWNIVKLNGLYYNVDSTWDAGYDEYIWFLNSFWDFGGHERDMEYDTIAFHNKYPIAAESYEKGVTGTKDPYIYAGYAGAETTNVVWYLGRDGSITFKGEGAIYDYSNGTYSRPFYSYWENEITKAVVEEGITRLGNCFLYSFGELKEIVLPSTVTEIGSKAFEYCVKLADIDFGSANIQLGESAFRDCNSLTEIQIHAGITLSRYSFYSCDNLQRAWIDCEVIPRDAFAQCFDLTELAISDRVTTIEYDAFSCCSITELVIPDSVTSLSGFSSCNDLVSVTLPETLTRIGGSCFSSCKKLEKIDLPEGLQTIGSYAFEYSGLTEIDIPESVTDIGASAFAGTKLTQIDIPKTVTSIGVRAFYSCKYLQRVRIDCEILGSEAFDSCPALTEIILTDRVTTVEKNAFRNCDALTEVVIPESVTSLSGFAECDNLVSVVMPKNLTEIGESCFSGCTKLDIELHEGLLTIGKSAFENSNIVQINIPDTVTAIGENAFFDCDYLTEIRIPADVTLGESCFKSCGVLERVWIDCAIVPTEAFSNCKGLTEIVLSERVTTIEYAAFSNCAALTEVIIPAGVTYLAGFNDCANLERVELHNSGTIGRYAFEECQKLKDITIPEGIIEIQASAFCDCESLSSIVVPHSVTELGPYVFAGCSNMESAVLNNRGKVQVHAFLGCRKLTNITLGENITHINGAAFDGCSALKEITFLGDAPAIDFGTFSNITATAHYPMNASWTEDKLQNYGGNITWVGYSVCTEHEYSAVVTAPTCTEQGFTTYTCTICGESYVGDEVEATGHSYEATVTDPTCNKRGFTTYTCSVCGNSYADDYVDALGHKFEDEICTVCGSPERIPGDIDGNEIVDVDDVLALLWHVLFPDDYPIEAEADFDGNETVDVDDVLALLWHVLFPEEYPI